MSRSETDAALACELPYWDFLDKPAPHAVLFDGSLVGGLQVGLKDIECLGESEVNQFTLTLRAALNSISENTSLQFVFSVRSDFSEFIRKHEQGWRSDVHPLVGAISEYRCSQLKLAMESAELYRPRLFVYLRIPMSGTKRVGFFRRPEEFSRAAEAAYRDTLESLSENLDSLRSSFENAGLPCEQLSRLQILSNVYEFLNPKRSMGEPVPRVATSMENDFPEEIIAESDWLAQQSPREQLVFGDLLLGFDQFTLDSHYHRVITLKTLPEVTVAGQLSSFLQLPFHYDLILSLQVPSQASEMAKLEQKRKVAHSLAATQAGKVSDLESESKLSSTEELIRELLNTGQRIYAVQLSLVLKQPATLEGTKVLNRQVREVLARLRALQGAEGLEESVGAWKVLKGNLPAAPVDLVRAKKMKTDNLADFLPVYGPREGDKDPVVVFRNRMNGLVGYDGFNPNLPNYNCLVTGASGAGKSFLNNCILLQELARGLRVFIIDIGGSYKKLTEALGGQYLEINLSDQYRVNPFDLPDPSQEPSTQKLKSLLACIECMIAEDESSKLRKLDRVLLEKAIIELYATKQAESKLPTLSDLMDHLSRSSEASMQAMAKMLYTWTGDRPYGRLLDGCGSLCTDAPICTFDLKGLSSYPDLQGVMILLLTDFILGQVERDKSNKKRIILDEAWELLKSNAAASFMEYCARTLRKTGSGITFITQGLEELLASPVGKPILNNTAVKVLLLQRGDLEQVGKAVGLNSQQINLVRSLEQRKGEYSEALLIEGDHRQVIRIFPSPIEYWLSTSDASDNSYLEKLRNDGQSLVEAIGNAARVFPNGIARGPTTERGVYEANP